MTPAEPGPVALVTGASRGIGLAIAQSLTDAGYRVARTARSQEALRSGWGGEGLAVTGDLHQPDAPLQILTEVERELGPVSVLVNNAGTAPSDRIENTGDEVLDEVLDLHVKAPFRLLRAALPKMRDLPEPVIVQLASTAGLRGFPFTAAYTAAKHGMVGLTRAMAAELQGTAIRVYAVCAGFVDTDITRQAAVAIAGRGKQTAEEAMARMGAMNDIGRMHQPEEVAAAVLKLVQERPAGCIYNLDREPPGFVD